MKNISMVAMCVATFFGGAALAHTELKTTVPANAAVIAEVPENVELTFSEPVRLTALSIQKDGEKKQSLGPLPSGTAEAFSVALPATTDNGHFVVTWRVMSEDTHVMTGEFMFAVGAQGDHEAHMNAEGMPAADHQAKSADDDHGAGH